MAHPLAATKTVTIDVEFDEESGSFVTYVRDLHGMSTFGETETQALDNTAEMIRGYIKSMEANEMKIPLGAARLKKLKRLVWSGPCLKAARDDTGHPATGKEGRDPAPG